MYVRLPYDATTFKEQKTLTFLKGANSGPPGISARSENATSRPS